MSYPVTSSSISGQESTCCSELRRAVLCSLRSHHPRVLPRVGLSPDHAVPRQPPPPHCREARPRGHAQGRPCVPGRLCPGLLVASCGSRRLSLSSPASSPVHRFPPVTPLTSYQHLFPARGTGTKAPICFVPATDSKHKLQN